MLRDPHTQISGSTGYQDVRHLLQKPRGKYKRKAKVTKDGFI